MIHPCVHRLLGFAVAPFSVLALSDKVLIGILMKNHEISGTMKAMPKFRLSVCVCAMYVTKMTPKKSLFDP